MPKTGDYYTVSLKEAHMDWGRHRYTHTRERIEGEGYVQIPKRYAEMYGIHKGDQFTATFADGFPSFAARAAGNSTAGDILAKIGDTVRVTFTAPDVVLFELLK